MVDAFGRKITYLRLSVTSLCNLRCRYCMPNGVCKKTHAQMMTEEETIRAVLVAASLGIKKLRITGGEPLLKKNILSLCKNISEVEGIEDVSLTTNGILLPAYAKDLVAGGVKRVNISLDTLDADKYRFITRTGNLSDALKGLEAALAAGFQKVKINSVLIGGFNDDEIVALSELTRQYPVDVRFIEWMPMTELSGASSYSYLSAQEVIDKLGTRISEQKQDGVAQLFRLKNGQGNIGLIRPISRNFCASCNRIRITADGKVRPCLHEKEEYVIKGLTEEEMLATIKEAILHKPEEHPDLSGCFANHAGRSMNEIGG